MNDTFCWLTRLLVASLLTVGAEPSFASDPVDQTSNQTVQKAPGNSSSDLVLTNLLGWLPGDYTNTAVLQLASTHTAPSTALAADNDLLTTHFRRVDLPQFGDHVLFLEEYRGVEAIELERVRLYVFKVNHDSDSVELRLLNPKDSDALKGAHNDLDSLTGLTLADITIDRSVCTLSFSALPTGIIVGRMTSGACDVGNTWVDYELHVGLDGHWVCYNRRSKLNDAITWQLIPPLPCVLMSRIN
jgi:hypothetical protein